MSQPVIILVRPQLGENIGKTARAMLNFGLSELRLVAPRDGWPNPDAGPPAAGADQVLDQAVVFDRLEDAIADCHRVVASTMRTRGLAKPVTTPAQAAAISRQALAAGQRPAILFGSERAGLNNDEVALADTLLTIPVNPAFGSLNLAQAVIVYAYEWFKSGDDTAPLQPYTPDPPATKAEMQGLYEQGETALTERGYFRSEARREVQIRSMRTFWQNCALTSQEVQTLRGILKTLTWEKRQR